MRKLSRAVIVLCALSAAVAAAAHREASTGRLHREEDFEFDEDAPSHSPFPRNIERRQRQYYLYDPTSPLCGALRCPRDQLCVLRAASAHCAPRSVALSGVAVEAASSDEDVFYDSDPSPPAPPSVPPPAPPGVPADKCVGCESMATGSHEFVCGSDNRTYSSLCRLDLHNCLHAGGGAGSGAGAAVALACRGFCPCRRDRPARRRKYQRYIEEESRRRLQSEHNEVLPRGEPPAVDPPDVVRSGALSGTGGAACDMQKMSSRLLDWFSVLMQQARQPAPSTHGFPGGCQAPVRWMFSHLDLDSDRSLSDSELYALKHDAQEACLAPFIAQCAAGAGGAAGGAVGAGGGGGISRAAWCACLRAAEPPCRAARRDAPPDGWRPLCDAAGYYRRRQCARRRCWCVDPHGARDYNCRGIVAAPADDEDLAAGSGGGAPDLLY